MRHLPLSVMSSRFSSTYYKSNSPQRPGIPAWSDSYDPAKMIPGAYPEDRQSKGYFISSYNSIIFMYHSATYPSTTIDVQVCNETATRQNQNTVPHTSLNII